MKYNACTIHCTCYFNIKKISLNDNSFAVAIDGKLIRLIKIKFETEMIHIKVFKVTNVYFTYLILSRFLI